MWWFRSCAANTARGTSGRLLVDHAGMCPLAERTDGMIVVPLVRTRPLAISPGGFPGGEWGLGTVRDLVIVSLRVVETPRAVTRIASDEDADAARFPVHADMTHVGIAVAHVGVGHARRGHVGMLLVDASVHVLPSWRDPVGRRGLLLTGMQMAIAVPIEPVVELMLGVAVGHVGEHRVWYARGQVPKLQASRTFSESYRRW